MNLIELAEAARPSEIRNDAVYAGDLILLPETDGVEAVQITAHTEKETCWCVDFVLKQGAQSFRMRCCTGTSIQFLFRRCPFGLKSSAAEVHNRDVVDFFLTDSCVRTA